MVTFFRRLLREDSGQDVLEYALLAAFVAIAGAVALQAIEAAMNTAYTSWNTRTQALWVMPAPRT